MGRLHDLIISSESGLGHFHSAKGILGNMSVAVGFERVEDGSITYV